MDRLRSVQALLRLVEQVGQTRLEAACTRASYFGDVRYRRIKDVLNAALDQQLLPAPMAALGTPAGTFVFERTATELFGQVAARC